MEEDKKEIIDEISVNNEESMNDVENSVQENDVKESETKKESSNVKSIVIILILFIILVGAGVYGLFFVRKEESNSNKDNSEITDNNIQEEIPTFSDDVVDEEVDNNIEGKVINIYQKGYAEKGPIAFTYECNSENCDLKVTDKGFILYDEDVVKYRDMTSYEYEQINNSEVSPIGSRLDMDGFDNLEPLFDGDEKIFKISNEFYILHYNNSLKKVISTYNNYVENNGSSYFIIDNLILYNGRIYDYVNKKNIYFEDDIFNSVRSGTKKGKFYIFDVFSSVIIVGADLNGINISYSYSNPWVDDKDYISNNVYVNDDKCYYIDNTTDKREITVINSKNEKLLYDNVGIYPLYIFDDKLIYLDKDGFLSVKNILNDNNIYKTDIKLKNAYLVGVKEGFQIFEIDNSVLNDEIFEQYRKDKNVSDKEINEIKKCINDVNECKEFCYMVGNIINLDKDGKFISKEYYLTPSQLCVN